MNHNQVKKNSKLGDIEILSMEPIVSSKYIQPMRVTYKQDGIVKTWDYVKKHDSVAILIFNVTSQCFVLVKQFRPAVYLATIEHASKVKDGHDEVPGSLGVTYELCAGIIDRPDKACDIASSEVLEETGYKIDSSKLELIIKCRTDVGTSGNLQHLFYAEVTDDMKVSEGGGIEHEGEMIDLFDLKLSDVRSFMNDHSILTRPYGLLYALSWFLENKTNKS